jgi:hypothetical protein
MEDGLENNLGMFQKVQATFLLHTAETAAIPAVAALSAQLDTKVNAILAVASRANTDITGYTVDKQAKRTDLKNKVLKLGGGVVAFTALSDDFKTIEKCDATPSQIDGMRDNDFYTYAKLVINEATPIMASLTPFGVVAADLTAANTSATNYLKAIQAPKAQINERSGAKKDLAALVAETNDLLQNKIDKVMGVFITTNPSFYDLYRGARSIDDTGSVTQPDYETVCNANTISLVADLPNLSSRSFTFENTGTVPLSFALSARANTLEGTVLVVEPGAKHTRSTTNLNSNPAASKVYVKNADLLVAGSYKVWVEE